jgi:hypothetical protein
MQKMRNEPDTPPELKKVFDALPPSDMLFKDVPSLVAFTVTRPDRAEVILHSPLPVAPLLALGVLQSVRNAAKAPPTSAATKPAGTK